MPRSLSKHLTNTPLIWRLLLLENRTKPLFVQMANTSHVPHLIETIYFKFYSFVVIQNRFFGSASEWQT